MTIKIQLQNGSNDGLDYEERGSDIAVELPDEGVKPSIQGAKMIVPNDWTNKEDQIEIPTNDTELYCRHEFIKNGQVCLRKEEFITGEDLIEIQVDEE